MQKFRFLEWKVYQEARVLVGFVIEITKRLPREYRFEISSQIIRSSLSILLNIAEGSGKTSDAELNRFFDIALGSAYETLAAADVLYNNKLVTKKDFKKIYTLISSITDQLGGFKKKLNNN